MLCMSVSIAGALTTVSYAHRLAPQMVEALDGWLEDLGVASLFRQVRV